MSEVKVEMSTSNILALLKGKKYDEATQAIEQLNTDLDSKIEEIEAAVDELKLALSEARKAKKDAELMAKFVDQAITLEANGTSVGGTSMRNQLRELDPRVSLGLPSLIADRAREVFGNRQKPKIVPEEG